MKLSADQILSETVTIACFLLIGLRDIPIFGCFSDPGAVPRVGLTTRQDLYDIWRTEVFKRTPILPYLANTEPCKPMSTVHFSGMSIFAVESSCLAVTLASKSPSAITESYYNFRLFVAM